MVRPIVLVISWTINNLLVGNAEVEPMLMVLLGMIRDEAVASNYRCCQ